MAQKHYGAANANRTFLVNGTNIRFTPYDHTAGAWSGFYSTSVPSEQSALDALVASKDLHIMEGWEIEEIKKKVPSLIRSTEFPAQQDQLENAEAVGKAEVEALPEVEDVLSVEKVAKPAEKKKRGRPKK